MEAPRLSPPRKVGFLFWPINRAPGACTKRANFLNGARHFGHQGSRPYCGAVLRWRQMKNSGHPLTFGRNRGTCIYPMREKSDNQPCLVKIRAALLSQCHIWLMSYLGVLQKLVLFQGCTKIQYEPNIDSSRFEWLDLIRFFHVLIWLQFYL